MLAAWASSGAQVWNMSGAAGDAPSVSASLAAKQLAWHPDGTKLASLKHLAPNSIIEVWDASSWTVVASFSTVDIQTAGPWVRPSGDIQAAAPRGDLVWSPSGDKLACGGVGSMPLTVWDWPSTLSSPSSVSQGGISPDRIVFMPGGLRCGRLKGLEATIACIGTSVARNP